MSAPTSPSAPTQFAVIGLGVFGRSVARTLHAAGHEVLAIDEAEALVREAHHEGIATHVVQADAQDPGALRELDVHALDAVVVAIGTDLEASLLVVLNLLEQGVTQIVAKAIHARHAQILERIGQGRVRVVMPEAEMGVRVAEQLAAPAPGGI